MDESIKLLLASLPALIGSLVGATAALLSAQLTFKRQLSLERMKWNREDQARFHTNRRELYARFLVLASEVHQNATLHEKSREFEGRAAASFVEKYGSLTSEKGTQLYLLLEEITLVGNTDVVKAAREIVVTVLHWRIASHLPGSGEMDKASGEYFGSKRQRFLDAARIELGIAPLEIEFKHDFQSQKAAANTARPADG